MPFAPGTLFGSDFRVVRPIAEGGMGAVYEVEQLSTGRKRALKTMHAALASNANSRERFTQEARIGSAIDSDHVVEVLAAGVDDSTGVPWLVMEMLDGGTLGDRIERGPLSPSETLAVMDQMCHALAAAHRSGIVHRDLKPDNVFLAKARRGDVPFTVKILDFGIAKWVQELQGASANSQAMGTPMWMAPEQASPGVSIRPFTDVWALGLMAFAMLTGRSYWRSASTPGASVQSLVVEIMVGHTPRSLAEMSVLSCTIRLTARVKHSMLGGWKSLRSEYEYEEANFVSSGLLRSVTYQPATPEHPCDSTAQFMDQLGEFLLGRRGDKVKGRCSRCGVEVVDPVDRDHVRMRVGLHRASSFGILSRRSGVVAWRSCPL